MNTSKKCHRCGLVNFATEELCRRCSADLDGFADDASPLRRRSKTALFISAALLIIAGLLFWGYQHKQKLDREFAEQAELIRHQDEPLAPASTPGPDPLAEQMKRWKDDAEKQKKQIAAYSEALKKPGPAPSPVFSR